MHAPAIDVVSGGASCSHGSVSVGASRPFVGGALNNADLSWDSPNWGLGCNQSFHLALSAGVDVTERVSVKAFANHFLNANLCYSNGGHEDAGLRVGFRF